MADGIHARFALVRFDGKEFAKSMVERLESGQRQAAREWLRAVLARVPLWTGTARGTFIPIGRFLRVAIPLSPIRKTLPGRGPSVGATKSLYEFSQQNGILTFTFVQGLEYFLANDQNVTFIKSSPWHSLDAGKEAYDAYMEYVAGRLPKVADYITYSYINF